MTGTRNSRPVTRTRRWSAWAPTWDRTGSPARRATPRRGPPRLADPPSTNRQIPSGLGRLHPQRSTPYVLIIIAGLIAAGLVVPEDLDFLIGIYAFGAMLAFTIAHLSICRLG